MLLRATISSPPSVHRHFHSLVSLKFRPHNLLLLLSKIKYKGLTGMASLKRAVIDSSCTDDKCFTHNSSTNIAGAVALDGGLMTPIFQHADKGLEPCLSYFKVLVRRELDLSAKELQEQVRSGDASATEYFGLGAVMLRRKFYPAATKYLPQAIENGMVMIKTLLSHSLTSAVQFWCLNSRNGLVNNALGVSYVREGKTEKGIAQLETAVKLQPGYVTAWNNLGDAYEKKKDLKAALKAFQEVLLFDPNKKVARPRRDALKDRVQMYKGVPSNPKMISLPLVPFRPARQQYM